MKLSLIAIAALLLSQQGIAQPVPFLTKAGKYQYVNAATLQAVNSKVYSTAQPFSEGLALVSEGAVQSFIREDGNMAYPVADGEASSFRGTVSVVANKKNHFLVDKNGRQTPVEQQVDAWTAAEGYIVMHHADGACGYLNISTGREAIPASYQFAWPFSEGLAAVKMNGRYGFIDKQGGMKINVGFDDARSFTEGVAPVKVGGYWGYINKSGEMVIRPAYGKVTGFVNGHAFAMRGDRDWVVIDNKGQITGEALSYQMITQLCDGLAGVMVNNLWGFCDVNGKLVIPPSYTITGSFDHGLAMVAQNGQRFYINTKGKEFRAK